MARRLFAQGVDVILGGGGTGKLLRRHLNEPVVTISRSHMSILQALMEAREYTDNVAVTCYDAIPPWTELFSRLLHIRLQPIRFTNSRELTLASPRPSPRAPAASWGAASASPSPRPTTARASWSARATRPWSGPSRKRPTSPRPAAVTANTRPGSRTWSMPCMKGSSVSIPRASWPSATPWPGRPWGGAPPGRLGAAAPRPCPEPGDGAAHGRHPERGERPGSRFHQQRRGGRRHPERGPERPDARRGPDGPAAAAQAFPPGGPAGQVHAERPAGRKPLHADPAGPRPAFRRIRRGGLHPRGKRDGQGTAGTCHP